MTHVWCEHKKCAEINIQQNSDSLNCYFFYLQQFLFSDKTIKFFKGLIQKIGVKRVLCVGTPRLVFITWVFINLIFCLIHSVNLYIIPSRSLHSGLVFFLPNTCITEQLSNSNFMSLVRGWWSRWFILSRQAKALTRPNVDFVEMHGCKGMSDQTEVLQTMQSDKPFASREVLYAIGTARPHKDLKTDVLLMCITYVL